MFRLFIFSVLHYLAKPVKRRHKAGGECDGEGEIDDEFKRRDERAVVHINHSRVIIRISVCHNLEPKNLQKPQRNMLQRNRNCSNSRENDMLFL